MVIHFLDRIVEWPDRLRGPAFGHVSCGEMDRRRGASGDDSGCRASPVFVRVRRAKEPMLFGLKPDLKGVEEKGVGLKAECFGLHAGSHPLEGISRGLKAEEQLLEPGELGLEGEERLLKAEEQVFEAEEHFLEPGELGLEGEEQVLKGEGFGLKPSELGLEGESFALQGMRSEVEAGGFPGTIRLDRSCLLDLLAQIPRPSLVTGLEPARASLTPRLAEASASQSLPSQLHRSG